MSTRSRTQVPFFFLRKRKRPKEKECSSCHQVLPLSEFSVDKRYPGAISPLCNSCKKRIREQLFSTRTFPSEKQCKGCHNIKPITDFGHDKHHKDGHLPLCKSCIAQKNQRMKERWKQEREHASLPEEKTCIACNRTLSIRTFDNISGTKDGFASTCKECRRKKRKADAARWIKERVENPPSFTEKTCPSCQQTLPVESFFKTNTRRDGLSFYCTLCSQRIVKKNVEKWAKERVLKSQVLSKKECHLCHRILPIAKFTPHSHFKSGYNATCIECEERRHQQYMERWQKERQHKAISEKQCIACHQILPISHFSKNKRLKDGYTSLCKDCNKAIQQRYRKRWRKERENQNEFTLFPTLEKTCCVCKRTLPFSMFYVRNGAKDGHNASCRECDLKHAKIYNAQRKTRPKITPKEKICTACNQLLPSSAFNKSSIRSDGLDSLCKPCRYKKYHDYLSNPVARENLRAWERAYSKRPEVRAKSRKWARKYARRPYVKAKRKAYSKEYLARPEVIQHRKEYILQYHERKKLEKSKI